MNITKQECVHIPAFFRKMNWNKVVLAPAHRDPLFKIKGLRKIECFSEKRLRELKILIKEYVSFSRDKKDSISGKTSGIQHGDRSKGKEGYINTSYSSFFTVSNRERVWWDKENWKDIEDIENPWGELRGSEEYFLKKILKKFSPNFPPKIHLDTNFP